ncbi:hypothetical protein AMTR_s00005p00261390 [Amborella trichopoda]|uniref:Uncharacterized protein n=1 Tax=Amborella trichopoda TaxID=13333 RepID=W1PH12_AMBTC|nr:hypothetical protein AMTR_s00005p00261390 [Amborella trichopoda]
MIVKNLGSDKVNKETCSLVASNEQQKVPLHKSQDLELPHVDAGVVFSDKPRRKCQKRKKRPSISNENDHLLPSTFPIAFIKDSSISEPVDPSFLVRPQGPPNLLMFGNLGVVDPSKDQLTSGRPVGPPNPLVFGRFGDEVDPSHLETRSRSHMTPLWKRTLWARWCFCPFQEISFPSLDLKSPIKTEISYLLAISLWFNSLSKLSILHKRASVCALCILFSLKHKTYPLPFHLGASEGQSSRTRVRADPLAMDPLALVVIEPDMAVDISVLQQPVFAIVPDVPKEQVEGLSVAEKAELSKVSKMVENMGMDCDVPIGVFFYEIKARRKEKTPTVSIANYEDVANGVYEPCKTPLKQATSLKKGKKAQLVKTPAKKNESSRKVLHALRSLARLASMGITKDVFDNKKTLQEIVKFLELFNFLCLINKRTSYKQFASSHLPFKKVLTQRFGTQNSELKIGSSILPTSITLAREPLHR